VWFDEWSGIEASALDESLVESLRPEVYRLIASAAEETLYMKVHDAWTLTTGGASMFPTEVTGGVIYVIRNPLDMAASCAHHWGTSIERAVENLCTPGFAGGQRGGLDRQLRQRTGSWSEHVRSWVDESRLPTHVISYEQLHQDPVTAFGGVVRFCGLDEDPDRLRRAVAFSSFEELRRQEADSGFRERSPAAPGPFFRRGEVGSWRDELAPELAARLARAHGELMTRFGYNVAVE
jgi:aryl sulfotransferase